MKKCLVEIGVALYANGWPLVIISIDLICKEKGVEFSKIQKKTQIFFFSYLKRDFNALLLGGG